MGLAVLADVAVSVVTATPPLNSNPLFQHPDVKVLTNMHTKVYRSIQIDFRQTLLLGGIEFQLQIQNRAARRMNFHYRYRSMGISPENLSLQIQLLS